MPADPSRISDPAVRALARELGQVRRELDLVKAGQRASQLGNSSIEDGTLWFNDAAGIQRVGIGAQIDGKFGWFAVNGEAPPRPNMPQLIPAVNGVAIVWNGEFSGPAPSDFVHAKAYLSPVGQNFIPSDGNVVGHLLGASTLPVTPLDPNTDYYAVLIAYNTSGVASDPSFVAGPVRPTAVVATEILDGIVTETKLAAGAVTQAKLAAGSVGTAQLGNQVVDLSKLANGSVDATKIVDGSITPAKVTFTAADIGSIVTYYQASAPTGTIPTGSLWADSDDQNKLYRYSGSGWVAVNDQGVANALASAQQAQTDAANAITAASGAQTTANSKVTVYYQNTSPSGANTGDLWINTGSNNMLQRWSGSAWVAVPDTRIAAALVNAQTAQATADGKITAFYQGTAPASGMGVGDLWYNTAAGNAVSRWNGTAWVALPAGSGSLADGAVTTNKLANGSVTPAKVTFTAADIGSIVTYSQASAPTGTIATGSLWLDGNNKLSRWNGTAWVAASDADIATALSTAQSAQTNASQALTQAAGAQATADGKVTVFYTGSTPTTSHVGDLWINTASNNRLSRWSGSAWVLVDDQRIATALANAATAQSTADGKIDAFYQNDAPTSGMSVGDLWYDLDGGNLAYRWNGSSWVSLPVGSAAISSGAIGTAHIQNGAVTGTSIAGGAVDTSKLASGAVDASKIAANAVTAPAILDGAVGSAELAANSVIAGKVAANAITAGTISAGVVGATELAANSVVAGKIAANAVTAGTVAANTIGANELIANSIVAGKLAADSVTSTNIVAGGVQTANLAADSVAAGKIAAEAVTAREIKALTITGDKVAANTIDAGQIKAGAVTADKLTSILALVSTLIAGDPNGWRTEIGDAVTPLLYWDGTKTGFAVSRDQTTGQANVYMSGRVEFGNGSTIEQDYLDLCEQVSTGFQTPMPRQSRTLIYSEPVTNPSPPPSWVSATGVGNTLLMSVLGAASGGAPTFTVPTGWTLIDTVVFGATSSTRLSLYRISGAAASRTSETVSANKVTSWSIQLIEYAGLMSASFDVTAKNSGTGTTASSGTTGTPSQANEVQVAVFGTPGAASAGKSGFSAPTNGFNLLTDGGGYNNQGSAAVAKVVTGTVAASTSMSVAGSNPWAAIVATFRTATAAPVPAAPRAKTVRLFTQQRGGASTPFVVDSASNVYPVGRVPYCKVRLTSDVFLTANLDVYAQGSWVSAGDPWGMVAISSSAGTFSNITIPFTGLYRVDYKAIFQSSSNTTSTVCAFVTKNGRDAANNSIARDARKYVQDGGDGSPVQASRELVLQANDQLFWGNFSSVNTNFYTGRLNIPTEITVTYMGVGG